MLIRGDARRLPLRDASVHAVVTSPPYIGQRGYGDHPLEGGTEDTLAEYVAWVADVFDEVRRVLRPDGLAWLNIGDKANGSGGGGGDWTRNGSSRSKGKRWGPEHGPKSFLDPAYPPQSFLDAPGAVLRELLARGWRLRVPIVWDKGVEERASLAHLGRPRWAHEVIYLLAPGPMRPRFFPSMVEETGSVWHFGIRRPGRPKRGAPHLAPFPDELARRCILPSTLPGDIVLDPFDGSGTTRRVALDLGRRAVGVDLYAGIDLVEPEALPEPPVDPQPEPEPDILAAVRARDAHDGFFPPTGPGMADLGFRSAAVYYYAARELQHRTAAGTDHDQAVAEIRQIPDLRKLTDQQIAYIEATARTAEPEAAS